MTASTNRVIIAPQADASELEISLSRGEQRTRLGYRIVAALFVAGIGVQFFIVGIALFTNGSYWSLHQPVGHALGLFPLTMLVLSFVGNMSWRTRILTASPIILVAMQQVTVTLGGWASALHPVNALLIFWVGLTLYRRSASGPDSMNGARA